MLVHQWHNPKQVYKYLSILKLREVMFLISGRLNEKIWGELS